METSPGQIPTQKTVASFSRVGDHSAPAKAAAPDRMFKRKDAPPPQQSFKHAYDATIAKNATGLLHARFPFRGQDIFVDVDHDTVRLGSDPATIKADPLMTIGPGGKMTHGKNITGNDCILLSGVLWAVQISNKTMLF